MDPSMMEAANPLFSSKDEGTAVGQLSERYSVPLAQKSTKSLKEIPADTTLNKEDWEMIEDSLLPFECTAILIALGGVAFIGLTIDAFVSKSVQVDIAVTLLDGLHAGPVMYFLMVIPCIIGSVQILLAGFFGMLAALESWQHVSIQDVIRHHLPDKAENWVKRVPLTCTAMKVYLCLMWIFLLIQFVASAIAVGVNDTLRNQANQGADAGDSSQLVREVFDYSAAMFNGCCAANGWSKQGYIPQCAPGTTTLANCTLPPLRTSLASRLCTCYTVSQDQYLSYEQYVNNSRVCNVTTEAIITIPQGQKIPGTDISIRTLIPSSVTAIPLVGDMDGNVFGCGTGYIRGFQWHMAQWSTNELEPYFLAMLIISGLQIIFLVVGSSLVCRIKVTPTPVMDEDGNMVYGQSKPLEAMDIPRGIRGLFFKHPTPSTSVVMSPQFAMPRFNRSNSSSGKSPRSPQVFELSSAPSPEQQIALGITSPEQMRNAAMRTSVPNDQNPPPRLHLVGDSPDLNKSKPVDIDGVI